MAEPSSKHYTLVQGTGSLQRLWYLNHRMGVWSNILVTAHYAAPSGAALTKDVIVDALRIVVDAQPVLSHIFVQRPSPNKGRHQLHAGALHTIDLEKCVEYVVDEDESGITSTDFERLHNEWLWTADEPDQPLWKLVVKGHNICFVYHHSLGDGRSGMVFHREFLAALNAPSSTKMKAAKDKSSTIVHPRVDAPLPQEPEDVWEGKDSLLEAIWTALTWLILQLYYGSSRIYGDLPPSKPYVKSATVVAGPDQRTVTSISTQRIPAEQMSRVIDACRARQVTFTPLLITMLTIVFATEFYPEAKFGGSRWNFDLRTLMDWTKVGGGTEHGTFVNASGGWQTWHRLGTFRRVLVNEKQGKSSSLDTEAVWNLVGEYKADMTDVLAGKGMRHWIGVKRFGTDLEDVVEKALPNLPLLLKPTFSVSNLGIFSNEVLKDEKQGQQKWRIDDMQFSAAAVRGTQGTHGAIFHVAGVKGGDTIINATYEDGIVPREMAEKILERTVARILEIV